MAQARLVQVAPVVLSLRRLQFQGREFDPQRLLLTHGRTLCLNARVNFAPGHVEGADLYEATDARGRRHAVMVPDVCGNVSVLGERGERKRRLNALAVDGDRGGDDEWSVLATGAELDASSVPEPGSLAAVLAAPAGGGERGATAARRLIKPGAPARGNPGAGVVS